MMMTVTLQRLRVDRHLLERPSARQNSYRTAAEESYGRRSFNQ